jgi:hypothetical protein
MAALQLGIFDYIERKDQYMPTNPDDIKDPAARAAFLQGFMERERYLRKCTMNYALRRWENTEQGEWFRPSYLSESGQDEYGPLP